jgi:hypothetical protein
MSSTHFYITSLRVFFYFTFMTKPAVGFQAVAVAPATAG